MPKPKLSRKEHDILMQYGVLEMPTVPAVNKIAEHIKARGGRWSMKVSESGMAEATVTLLGKSFDSGADEENQALVTAFCQALKATQPLQATFMPPDPDDDGGGADEPATVLSSRTRSVRLTRTKQEIGDDLERAAFEIDPKSEELDGVMADVSAGVARESARIVSTMRRPEATPEEMASALRETGLPVVFDPATQTYLNPTSGDAYDGPEATWVGREYRSLPPAATTPVQQTATR